MFKGKRSWVICHELVDRFYDLSTYPGYHRFLVEPKYSISGSPGLRSAIGHPDDDYFETLKASVQHHVMNRVFEIGLPSLRTIPDAPFLRYPGSALDLPTIPVLRSAF